MPRRTEGLDFANPTDAAETALKQLAAEDEGWRIAWRDLFRRLKTRGLVAIDKGQPLVIEEPLHVVFAFARLEAMFTDLERGSENPLCRPRKTKGRRPLNERKRKQLKFIVTLTQLEITYFEKDGRSREETFRAVAARIRQAGGKATWREVRSAWGNQDRLCVTAVKDFFAPSMTPENVPSDQLLQLLAGGSSFES